MEIKYFEGENGVMYKVDYDKKEVFAKTKNEEKKIDNTDPAFRKAVVYGDKITKQEYLKN